MSSNKKVNLKKVILSAAIILLTLAGVLVYVLSSSEMFLDFVF